MLTYLTVIGRQHSPTGNVMSYGSLRMHTEMFRDVTTVIWKMKAMPVNTGDHPVVVHGLMLNHHLRR